MTKCGHRSLREMPSLRIMAFKVVRGIPGRLAAGRITPVVWPHCCIAGCWGIIMSPSATTVWTTMWTRSPSASIGGRRARRANYSTGSSGRRSPPTLARGRPPAMLAGPEPSATACSGCWNAKNTQFQTNSKLSSGSMVLPFFFSQRSRARSGCARRTPCARPLQPRA